MRARNAAEMVGVHSEGSLLSPEFLQGLQARKNDLPGTSGDAYGLPGARVDDVIGAAWVQMLGAWTSFQNVLRTASPDDALTEVTLKRWLVPLFRALDFGFLQPNTAVLQIDGRDFALSHQVARTPIHLVGWNVTLEKRAPGAGGTEEVALHAPVQTTDPTKDGKALRMAPHALMQTVLNLTVPWLWGIVSNGRTLRLLRDNQSLTRQSYVEFDLEIIFGQQRYDEFRVLWLLCHASRFSSELEAEREPSDCWLEKWRTEAVSNGVKALDRLRLGVQRCIERLGGGFLKRNSNEVLLEALRSRGLTDRDYYRQLLLIVYRLIFLLSAEDRRVLLLPGDEKQAARELYKRDYGLLDLRDRAGKTRGGPHGDLWLRLKIVLTRVYDGCPDLALPALGSSLFDPSAISWVDVSSLANEDLLGAFRELCYLEQDGKRQRVRWRDVGADELGSVYESLLELVPTLDVAAGKMSLTMSAGNDRKTSGSYYTPSSLVDCLLDSALDPVVNEAVQGKPQNEAEASLLALKVCDPACGSGHFLVAAARRLAKRLAMIRSGEDEPSPTDTRHALRDVVSKCVFGVDINPMAVELCKVSLWMEAVEPGRPLSFLDAHIQCGNALLGTTPALLSRGIPDEAWECIEGDDKAVVKSLKARNKKERAGQTSLQFAGAMGSASTQAISSLESMPDDAVAAIRTKEEVWASLLTNEAIAHERHVADTWCAAYVWNKQPGELSSIAPTHEVFLRERSASATTNEALRVEVEKLRKQYQFFHWHLAFSQVFQAKSKFGEDDPYGWDGGFDVVLGNPPWERVKLQEQEFFATRHKTIAGAVNAAARKKLIAALPTENPELWIEWCAASRQAEGESFAIRTAGRFPLCGKGDVNTYAIFAEHNRTVLNQLGRAGFIVPTGIATDDSAKGYFSLLVTRAELASFLSFENEENIFPSVHHAFKFALLAIDRTGKSAYADLVFFARQTAELAELDRHITFRPADFATINPNTRTCPTFRSRRDANLNLVMYRRAGVLWRDDGQEPRNPWGARFKAMIHMALDSGEFRTRDELEASGYQLKENRFVNRDEQAVPMIEAKMIHQFDHRFGTYEGQTQAQENQGKLPEFDDAAHAVPLRLTVPYYWVSVSLVRDRLAERWNRSWLLGWRDICRSTDQRTVIASLFPCVAVGHTTPLLFSDQDPESISALYANLCSFILDYAARQKIGGTHVTYGYLKQLPVLPPATYDADTRWQRGTVLRDWILPRVLELTYTAWDLEAFGQDVGYGGPPFRWDPARRALLRAELDAAFFHLYEIQRDDVDYIMDTFPIVRKNDEKEYGEYRTKRLILEMYDEMAEVARTGTVYRTRLDPPPADPSVAHPARE